jgi:hypothetical protein
MLLFTDLRNSNISNPLICLKTLTIRMNISRNYIECVGACVIVEEEGTRKWIEWQYGREREKCRERWRLIEGG